MGVLFEDTLSVDLRPVDLRPREYLLEVPRTIPRERRITVLYLLNESKEEKILKKSREDGDNYM